MRGRKPTYTRHALPERDAQRFVLSREQLTAICWAFFLHIDRNGDHVFAGRDSDELFAAALDEALGFAVECAVTGLAP